MTTSATAKSIESITAELLNAVKAPINGTKPRTARTARVVTTATPAVREPNELRVRVAKFMAEQRATSPEMSNYKLAKVVASEFKISSGNAMYYAYAKTST